MDSVTVKNLLSNERSVVHPELYRLQTPASPHIAARKDGVSIDGHTIQQAADAIMHSAASKQLIIEGAGGLLVPLTDNLMVAGLITLLNARVILVSRNYLGSINHSLLTAAYCRANNMDVAGWIFTDDYLSYENEIVNWSGYPSLGSVPKLTGIDATTVHEQAIRFQPSLAQKFNT